MSGGQGAIKKARKGRAKAKQELKKAALKMEKFIARLPQITEDDLVAFQVMHFGDDSRPADWFVPAEQALDPFAQEVVDLGCYPDGARRTLTDEQIAIFRHSELQQLNRERDNAEVTSGADADSIKDPLPADGSRATAALLTDDMATSSQQQASDSRSATPASTGSSRLRAGRQEIPYKQRNKRNWEVYIEDSHPTEGSMTHRRIAREMDDQHEENIELDY